jgi:hypothetical protein
MRGGVRRDRRRDRVRGRRIGRDCSTRIRKSPAASGELIIVQLFRIIPGVVLDGSVGMASLYSDRRAHLGRGRERMSKNAAFVQLSRARARSLPLSLLRDLIWLVISYL